MPTIAESDPRTSIHALVIARPKAGKTAFAGTWAHDGGIVAIADSDNGWRTLASKWFAEKNQKINLKNIRYEVFMPELDKNGIPKDDKAFWSEMEWINKQNEDPNVSCIVIDTLTSLSQLAMLAGLLANQRKNRSRTWHERTESKMLMLTQADYGAEIGAVTQIMDSLRKSKKHVLVLAHDSEVRNEAGGLMSIEPLITGKKMRGMIGQWFDEVWYLDTIGSEGKRILYTQPQGVIKSLGSRLGVPHKMEDPNYAKIIASLGS